MAKKQRQASSRRPPWMILAFLLLIGGGWAWHSAGLANWRDRLFQYIDNRDIVTFEARFSPEQIIEAHRHELLENRRTLQNSVVKYYPYLLLEVKYPEHSKTREGVLLWGLHEGEIVLNTETWETTHGFKDCLECEANRTDFKILQALARHPGKMSIEELQKELHVEREMLSRWIEGAKQKHLVVQKGNLLQLHFENPKLLVSSQTKIKQQLVSKPLGEGEKIPKIYSHSQVSALTQAAFGGEFKIRSEREVFLPIYSFDILNADGSVQTSEWNALTGQRIIPHYLFLSFFSFTS